MTVTQVSVGSQGSRQGGAPPTDRLANCCFHLSCALSWECRRLWTSLTALPRLQTSVFLCPLLQTLTQPPDVVPQDGESGISASREAPECLCYREKGIIMIVLYPQGETGRNPSPPLVFA